MELARVIPVSIDMSSFCVFVYSSPQVSIGVIKIQTYPELLVEFLMVKMDSSIISIHGHVQ